MLLTLMPNYNVLILCTGNSARSILTEAVFNTVGKDRFTAYSAGSHPTGVVHPLAIEVCQALEYPAEKLRSKAWDEFALPDAPAMDFVITVCDNARGEACPVWPGVPKTLHWGFEDPAAVQGTDAEKRASFDSVFNQIMGRVRLFMSLPLESLDELSIRKATENPEQNDG